MASASHAWRARGGLIYPCLSVGIRSKFGFCITGKSASFFFEQTVLKTAHTLITTKRVTSAASVPAAAADKAKRRPSGASASGRAMSQGRSVQAPAWAHAWAAPARKRRVPAAARRRTDTVAAPAPAPRPRHHAIAWRRQGSPLVASARARASRRSLRRKASAVSSRRRRC